MTSFKTATRWMGAGMAGLMMAGAVHAGSHSHTEESHDIVDTAIAAGQFETLVAAVEAAGLVDTLKGEGPFTVFAPTDEAFAALPEGTLDELLLPENQETLQSILTYHVVVGKVMAEDAMGLDSAETVQGQSITITTMDGSVMINDATVIQADIETSNGVIHVIDGVLLPE
ncbi:fasciclin domain-containing protein [Halomonas sp. MA07-2]|uniref:fasciclin domain-containing protein n=1 Tax=Halomonas sp. MA07-2 TaxID=3440841 RepID=UPI003EF00C46